MKRVAAVAAEMLGSTLVCPKCGARQSRVADECWLCGTMRGMDGLLGGTLGPRRFAFSLSTLLWINTLVAVSAALVVSLPGLGVFLSLILVPVALRTLLVLKRRCERGIITSRWEKFSLFLRSFVRTVLLAIFACVSLVELVVVAVMILFLSANGVLGNSLLVSILGTLVTVALWVLATLGVGVEKRFRYDTTRHASL
jgi:ribosomal protein L40E